MYGWSYRDWRSRRATLSGRISNLKTSRFRTHDFQGRLKTRQSLFHIRISDGPWLSSTQRARGKCCNAVPMLKTTVLPRSDQAAEFTSIGASSRVNRNGRRC